MLLVQDGTCAEQNHWQSDRHTDTDTEAETEALADLHGNRSCSPQGWEHSVPVSLGWGSWEEARIAAWQ